MTGFLSSSAEEVDLPEHGGDKDGGGYFKSKNPTFIQMNRNHYNKFLQAFAKENKQSMTKAEASLWKYALSKRQMLGYAFRRQRPIAKYIVDFICLKLRLVIEVDGYSHQLQENEIKDLRRQKKLEDLGFVVIRFKDEEVLNHMNQVREAIQIQITLLEKTGG